MVSMLQLHVCEYDIILMITMSKHVSVMFCPFYPNILFLILMLDTCEHVNVLLILILQTSESNVQYL